MNRVSMCDLLHQRHERNPFLKSLVTGDETWILYIEMCIENALGLRKTDLRLSQSLDFVRRKFFSAFGGTGKV